MPAESQQPNMLCLLVLNGRLEFLCMVQFRIDTHKLIWINNIIGVG